MGHVSRWIQWEVLEGFAYARTGAEQGGRHSIRRSSGSMNAVCRYLVPTQCLTSALLVCRYLVPIQCLNLGSGELGEVVWVAPSICLVLPRLHQWGCLACTGSELGCSGLQLVKDCRSLVYKEPLCPAFCRPFCSLSDTALSCYSTRIWAYS